MDATAGALSALIGPMTEGMVSAAQYQASKHERNIAWRRAQAWELMAPSLRMEGLRNAGLNPVLAATGGGMSGGGLSHPAMADTGKSPNFNADVMGAIASAQQIKVMKEVERKTRAEAERAEWDAKAARYLPEQRYHEAGSAAEYWNLLSEQTAKTRADRSYVDQDTRRLGVSMRLLESDLPSAKARQELYEKYPKLKMFNTILRDIRGQ